MHHVISQISLKFCHSFIIRILFQFSYGFFIWRPFVSFHKFRDVIKHVFCNFDTHKIPHSFRHDKGWPWVVVAQSSEATSLAIDDLNLYSKEFPIHGDSFVSKKDFSLSTPLSLFLASLSHSS